MATAILMPKMGLTMKNATVVKWLKEEGDPLREKERSWKSKRKADQSGGIALRRDFAEKGTKEENVTKSRRVGYVGKAGEGN
jgi:glycerol kinase